MTPEEIYNKIYAQIQADAERLINMPPQTRDSFASHVRGMVMEKWNEHGRPSDVDVEVQYDQESKAAEIIVTEHWPVIEGSVTIMLDEPKED